MEVDPAASLRCWAIDVELGGRTYEVPALPAADWMPVLFEADLNLVLDLFTSTPAQTDDLDELILTGQVNGEDLTTALIDAVEEAAGRSFTAACVLAYLAKSQWPIINGALARRGFRWDVMPLGAALDAIYSLAAENLKEEDRVKLDAALDTPLLTEGKPRPADTEKALDGFAAIAGPRPTSGVRATGAPSDNARPKTQPRLRRPRQGDPSPEPMPPPGPPAGSGPRASSAGRPDAAEPASGTGSRPPRPARSRPPQLSGASGSDSARSN